jgi:hypothetical protein
MAEIVELKIWRDTHPQRVPVHPPLKPEIRLGQTPQAELLLFLGVRYERLDASRPDDLPLRLDTH